MPRKKSKKLKHLEEKLKLVKKELARRKKLSVSTPSKSKRSRKSKLTVFEECSALLEKVKKMQYSKAFLRPVDWKNLNIPTYPQIIKHPMDLLTVENKLNNNSYETPYDFARDMRLIYQNATTFNKPTTPYYVAATKFAKKLEEEFERKVVDAHETNEFTKKICKVIVTLIKRDDSIPFRAPVNPQVLEIPDYHDVIETPMDLGTILNKINYYTQFKHFAHDLFLVWNNCCRYNPKQNQIHQTALQLKSYTQKQLNRYCQSDFQLWEENESDGQMYQQSSLSMGINNNISNNDNNNNNNNNTHIKAITSGENVNIDKNQNQNIITQTELQPGPIGNLQSDSHEDIDDNSQEDGNKESDIFKLCDDMDDEDEAQKIMISYLFKKQELDANIIGNLDFQQKEELQRGIQCLDSDHFDPLISMLQQLIPEGEGEDDEVELDVDSIDDELQVKMYNYMLRAITQQENERIKREGGNKTGIISTGIINSMNVNNDNNNNNNENDIKMVDNTQQQIGHNNNDIDIDMGMEVDVNKNDIMINNNEQSVNVVHAFPIGGDDDDDDDDDDDGIGIGIGGSNEMRVDSICDDENKQEQDEDQDIDMGNNNVNDNNDDIVADIANVVENNVVVNIDNDNDNDIDNDNDNEQKELVQIGNDNDVTDTEINDGIGLEQEQEQEQHDGERHVDGDVLLGKSDDKDINDGNVNENVDISNMNIPTMPVLQDDSDDGDVNVNLNENNNNNNEDGNVNEMNVEVKNDGLGIDIVKDNNDGNDNDNNNNNNVLGNEEIINGGLSVSVNDELNVGNDILENKEDNEEHNEDDDVETPLADEIEF